MFRILVILVVVVVIGGVIFFMWVRVQSPEVTQEPLTREQPVTDDYAAAPTMPAYTPTEWYRAAPPTRQKRILYAPAGGETARFDPFREWNNFYCYTWYSTVGASVKWWGQFSNGKALCAESNDWCGGVPAWWEAPPDTHAFIEIQLAPVGGCHDIAYPLEAN